MPHFHTHTCYHLTSCLFPFWIKLLCQPSISLLTALCAGEEGGKHSTLLWHCLTHFSYCPHGIHGRFYTCVPRVRTCLCAACLLRGSHTPPSRQVAGGAARQKATVERDARWDASTFITCRPVDILAATLPPHLHHPLPFTYPPHPCTRYATARTYHRCRFITHAALRTHTPRTVLQLQHTHIGAHTYTISWVSHNPTLPTHCNQRAGTTGSGRYYTAHTLGLFNSCRSCGWH